jgi:LPXTG-motif cell wall-anchored protein
MKRLKFLETKRTPRYSLRKFSVGVASVLLGVTIFGINFTNHSVKAATTESVGTNTQKATSATEKVQQNGASNGVPEKVQQNGASNGVPEKVQQNGGSNGVPEKVQQNGASNDVTEKVQQNSGSNNATANNSTESATTLQSSPKTQGSAHTDINSLAAKSAAKLAFMNLMAASDTGTDTGAGTNTGSDRNAAGTTDPNNINDQPAKENQKLANENNLTSSDNYSSNIYKGTDGKYYKVVTIYGNDYVYHAADIQANGTAFGQWATSAADTKSNINISKEDLGNGKTRWTVIFFPNKGLQNDGGTLHGLSSAKFGIALTNDYQIVGDVDMDITTDPNQTFVAHTFKDNSNSSTDITVSNPSPEVKFSFNPNTDVDPNTGLINSKTMPAYNNQYLQGPYYFNTTAYAGRRNLWQTYFEDGVEYNNAYDGTTPYLGGNHDFHLNNFEIKNETGVDGAKQGDKIIYDTLGYRLNSKNANPNGVFSSDNFNQAMEFKSQGVTSQSQFSSYKISFTTQHTDSHEVELTTGPKKQQFSGIAANIYSYQNKYYNMFSSLYGEQRALNAAGAVVKPNDVISGWVDATRAFDQIKKDYLNNAQIYALRYKIQNNVTDSNALNNIIEEGNHLNDAMKKLGNSIGQYDSDGSFADHKEDTTKASDRYKYANPDKKEAYDNATEVTKALINKDTGAYADQATVEKLTEAENKAWNELKVVLANKNTPNVPANPVPVADTSNVTKDEQAKVQKNVEDANKFPAGTTVTVDDKGNATITYPDTTTDTIPGSKLVRQETDAEKNTPNVPANPVPVADTSNVTKDEQAKVQKNVEDANKFPAGTTVTVDDKGNATITYPDTTTDTIPGSKLVRPTEDKDSYDPHGPKNPDDRVPVKDPDHLTDGEKNDVKDEIGKENPDLPKGTEVDVDDKGNATIKYPDGSQDTIPGDQLVQGQKGDTTDAGNITPTVPGDKVTVKDPSHLTDDEKNQVKNNVDNANKDKFPAGTKVTVGDDGTTTVNYPDGSKDTIPGDQLVQGQKGDTTDAGNITPTIPGDKVTVKDPSHLTDDEKNQVKNNVDNANKDKFPAGTDVTVGDDGTATVNYPDGSKDTIPGDQLVQGQKGDTTDAGNITPTVPGGKVTVKDPSHLTDDEKNQVKNNVDNANKGNFPAGTEVTVGDDGTATVTYPDGSKDVIAGTDLVIAAKGEDVLGSKYHSHKNGSNSSQADRVKGASTANGSIANAGNNLGVKAESDNAIGNNKATSLKTLPQTGTKDTSILGVLGMLLASLGLFGFKKKRDKE